MTKRKIHQPTVGFWTLALLVVSLVLWQSGTVSALDSNYRLVFADEFNGTSVNTSKWAVASPSWTMPNSLSTASASQVSVANGALTLNAIRTGSNTWSSGSISSYQKYNFSGGYVEARIQLPSTPGSWPAFWGLYTGWPPEADIMEYPLTTNGSSGMPNDTYNTSFHYRNSSGGNSAGAGGVDTNIDLRGGWHTFAMDWTAGSKVAFYFDGVQKSSFTSSSVSQMANMYMILDYAVGGWPGTPSTGQWGIGESDQTKVDWVRVWQFNSNNDASSTWNVDGGGSFSTGGNWTGAGVPKYGNQAAIFGRVGTSATATVTMPSWKVMGGMTFNGGATGTTAYTIGSSSTLIQLAGQPLGGTTNGSKVQASSSSTANQTVNSKLELWSDTTFQNDMTGGTTLNLNGQISGSGDLIASGVGATVLSSANTYTGVTNIGVGSGAGVLRVNANGALSTGAVTIGPAGNSTTARLEITGGRTIANAISFSGRNNSTVGIQNLSGNNILSGTITANAGGSTYLIQSDAGVLTLSGTSGSGVALQAGSSTRTFTLQGAGAGLVSGKIQNGAGVTSIAKAGAGTWTLNGANTFTGSVNVTGGRLALKNSGTMSSIAVSSGATLNTIGATTVSGALTSSGVIDLADTTLANLNTGTVSLTNSSINLELGAGTSGDKIVSTGAATITGTNTVNLSIASGQAVSNNTSHTLLTASGGLSTANFVIGSRPASLGFYSFTLSTPTGSALVVNVAGNDAPATAYWTGAGSTAVADSTNNWGSGATVDTSNWSTDAAGTIDARQVPGSLSNVIFNAANAAGSGATLTTRMDASYLLKGMSFDVAAGTGITSSVVNTSGNVLTVGSDGISVAATSNSAATLNGGGTVTMNGSQNWANNSSTRALSIATKVNAQSGPTTLSLNGTGTGGVSFSGVISDGAGIVSVNFNQAGTTTLSAINTYTGPTNINAGTVEITSTGKIISDTTVGTGATLRLTGGTDAIDNTANVSVNAGGTLDVRDAAGVAKAEALGSLNGAGTVTRSTAGATTLTLGVSDLSGSFSGTIQNGSGTLALLKTGTGTQTLAGPSNYTGGTIIADQGGAIQVLHGNALGTGALSIGQGNTEPTATLQIAGGITLSGVSTINLSSRSLVSDDGAPTIENISGNNTINANLNINMTGGQAANIVSDAGTLTLKGNLSSTGLSTSRVFDFAGEGNGIVTGIITNGTAQTTMVQKDGTGTWTLIANNTFTAGTTVNGGTLAFTGSNSFGTGSVTVNDGVAIFSNSNAFTGGTIITGDAVGDTGSSATGGRVVLAHPNGLGTGNIDMSGNATLEMATDGADRLYELHVGTNNIVNLISGVKTGSTGIEHSFGALFIGINDIVNVTAAANVTGGSPSIKLNALTLSSGFGAGTTTFNPTSADLTIGNVSTSTSGTKTLGLDGTSNGNIVQGVIANGTTTVAVAKSNSSRWTLASANTYTGGTTINDGTLVIGNNAALGTGAIDFRGGAIESTDATVRTILNPITFSADMTFSGPGNLVFGGAVNTGSLNKTFIVTNTLTEFSGILTGASTGTRTKDGPGTLVFSGANTYTGPTVVSAGTLRVTGSIAASSGVTVNGGTLGGNGTVPAITLSPGGAVSPGASIGTLKGASMIWNSDNAQSGGLYELSFLDDSSDVLALTGSLAKGTGSIFYFDFTGGMPNTTYTLITFASTTFAQSANSTEFAVSPESAAMGYVGVFKVDGNSVNFTPTIVPEPGFLAGLSVAGFVLLRGRRRR